MNTITNGRSLEPHAAAPRRTWVGLCLLAAGFLGAGFTTACDPEGARDLSDLDRAEDDEEACGEHGCPKDLEVVEGAKITTPCELMACQDLKVANSGIFDGLYQHHTSGRWVWIESSIQDQVYIMIEDGEAVLYNFARGDGAKVATKESWLQDDGTWMSSVEVSCVVPAPSEDDGRKLEHTPECGDETRYSGVPFADVELDHGMFFDPTLDGTEFCAALGFSGTYEAEDCSYHHPLLNGCFFSGNHCCEVDWTEPGCGDISCQVAVCEQDPYCCDQGWDELCVEKAQSTSECIPDVSAPNLCEPPMCGDGKVNGTEECEAGDLNGASCEWGGSLACGSDCLFDDSGCNPEPVCNNGVREVGEECDGADGVPPCDPALGFVGSFYCNDDCELKGECIINPHPGGEPLP